MQYFYNELKPGMPLSVDIETPGNRMDCVGFACSPLLSITLPWTPEWIPHIKWLCESQHPKILQNGLYDWYWLDHFNIKLLNYFWDTLAMHHAIDPIEDHALHYLASIFSKQPYWKDEAKDSDEIAKYTSHKEALWVYNGLDCCVTYEIWGVLVNILQQRGMLDFYHGHYSDLFQVLLDIMRHGVAIDTKSQRRMSKELLTECADIRGYLKEAAGEDLYGEKDFSNAKLQKFFYGKLEVPKQTKMAKRKTGMVRATSLDKTILKQITIRFPEKVKDYGVKVLTHRKKMRRAQYLKGAWDNDKRIRCSYKFTTEAGRLASSKNPMGKGFNLQNVERGPVRGTFLPNPGCVFVRVDLSQVEDREVKMCCRTKRMVDLANMHPKDYDAHVANAAVIFGVAEADVTKEQRYLGKRAVHASQRGMRGKTLSEKLLEDDYIIPPKRCQWMIDKYLKANWEIPDIYFPWIRDTLIRDKMLVNSWGRPWDVTYQMLGQDLYRRGYSFLPQSEALEITNQWGLKTGAKQIKKYGMATRMNLQVHDEVIASCPPDEAYDWAAFLVDSFQQPRVLYGNVLVVPACVTVGMSWADDGSKEFPRGHEFKELPSRVEFDKVVREVYHASSSSR
jgi:DNA polymerase-1